MVFDFFILETTKWDEKTTVKTGKKSSTIDSVWISRESVSKFVKTVKAREKEFCEWKKTSFKIKQIKPEHIRRVDINDSIKVSILNSSNQLEVLTVLDFEEEKFILKLSAKDNKELKTMNNKNLILPSEEAINQ